MAPSSDTSIPGDDATHISLYDLTPEQRQTYYKKLFSNKVEPLSHIEAPDECEEYPDFQQEIINAYLTWTTFTVKVWTNYDAAAQRFHIDHRIADCGKLVFKPSEWKQLKTKDPGANLQMTHVMFEVGTPFQTLGEVKLTAAPITENGKVLETLINAEMRHGHADHPRAVDFLADQCAKLDKMDLTGGNPGFVISELEQIAEMFVREPEQSEVSRIRFSTNPAPWMNVEAESRSGNPGFLDLEALDKECGSGCNGCTAKKYTSWYGGSSWYNR